MLLLPIDIVGPSSGKSFESLLETRQRFDWMSWNSKSAPNGIETRLFKNVMLVIILIMYCHFYEGLRETHHYQMDFESDGLPF